MSEPGAPRTILLDAYAARSCPVKTQNEYDRTLPELDAGSSIGMRGHSEALQELFAGSAIHDEEILSQIAATASGVVDLRPLSDAPSSERLAATRAAVEAGAPVILAPLLPLDLVGHRRGHPDLIVRGADEDGRPGYVPVHCKRAKVMQRRAAIGAPQFVSTLAAPTRTAAQQLVRASFKESRQPDALQLAHYWRLLEAAGWQAGGEPVGGLIGRDNLLGLVTPDDQWTTGLADTPVVCWINLGEKIFRTFARTAEAGWRLRSALERYDHEHGFRVMVAEVAAERTGASNDPPLRVVPIVVDECEHCQWWSICGPQLDENDLSLRIAKSRLDVREIGVLRSLGVETITDLADADLADLLPRYLPEVTHRPGAEQRLRLAAHRAVMLASGQQLERRSSGTIDCPRASLEIDLDIETSSSGHVYLWGFLVDEPGSGKPPRYVSFERFEVLDDASERELAIEALSWLGGVLDGSDDALVYHYSNYEIVHMRKLTPPDAPAVAKVLDRHPDAFVDLFEVVRAHFFGVHGLGLKSVAKAATGFDWRDDDPGGLNSQVWFNEAIGGATAEARRESAERILIYNEDDVRATRAIRRWLVPDAEVTGR